MILTVYGLPAAIRTDNGVPFASPHALFGLSRLSVWWLRLGINIERIKPGHPLVKPDAEYANLMASLTKSGISILSVLYFSLNATVQSQLHPTGIS